MTKRAFILIELIIYIGLFSIMIGGLLVSASLLIKNSYQGEEHLATTEELGFVIQKLTWALAGAQSLHVSSDNFSLYIQNENISSDEITFRYDPDLKKLELKTNSGGFFDITTSNVSVLNNAYAPTKFIFIPKGDEISEGVSIFLNIDGNNVEFNKYIQYANQD